MKKILICFILISLIFCSCETNPEDHFLISMSEFKRVELGDDYHEVVSIIGSEGNMLEEAGIKGTKL